MEGRCIQLKPSMAATRSTASLDLVDLLDARLLPVAVLELARKRLERSTSSHF